jgi:hypothetical protein
MATGNIPYIGCPMEGCWRAGVAAIGTTDGILYGKIAEVLPFGPDSLAGGPSPFVIQQSGAVPQMPTLADISQGKLAGNITPY